MGPDFLEWKPQSLPFSFDCLAHPRHQGLRMDTHSIGGLAPGPTHQGLEFLVSANEFPLSEVSTSENGHTQSPES